MAKPADWLEVAVFRSTTFVSRHEAYIYWPLDELSDPAVMTELPGQSGGILKGSLTGEEAPEHMRLFTWGVCANGDSEDCVDQRDATQLGILRSMLAPRMKSDDSACEHMYINSLA